MSHNHTHTPAIVGDLGPAFKLAIVLNVGYVLIEGGAGFVTGSLALLADAAHNLIDVAGLLIAWGAVVAAKLPPSEKYTYGFGPSPSWSVPVRSFGKQFTASLNQSRFQLSP